MLLDGSYLGNPRDLVAGLIEIALRPPETCDLERWASEHVVFGRDDPYPGPYDPDRFPHMREVLSALSPDAPARVVTLMGNAQGGKTVVANIFLGATLDMDPSATMITHPTLENAKRWSNTKWRPFVQSTPALKRAINIDTSRDSRSTMFYMERRDGRGFVIANGANSAASLSMITIKYQVQDDLAKWEQNSAGDPEPQADKRSAAHPFAKLFKASTPTVKGACRITRAWLAGTQEVREVPCPHCGEYQELTWENLRDSTADRPAETAHFSCTECGCAIERQNKHALLAAGRWSARNPAARDRSFRIWAAYMPNMEWSGIVEEWRAAKGDPNREQAFWNDTLGLAFEIAGEAPEAEKLHARAEAGGHPLGFVPPGGLWLTAGADCQVDRVEIRVWAWGAERRRWMIAREIIPGHISEDDTRAALDRFLEHSSWPDAFGHRRRIDQLAIDTGYATSHVYDWVRSCPRDKVMAVKGSTAAMAPEVMASRPPRSTKTGRKVRSRFTLWMIGTGRIKAAFYADLRKEDPLARGHVGLAAGLDEEEFRQIAAEKYVSVQRRNGYTEYEWRKAYERNEALDCYVYAEAAARRLDWHRLSDAQWQALAAEREAAPPSPQADMFDPAPAATIRPQTSTVTPVPAAPANAVRRHRRPAPAGEDYLGGA